MIAVALGEHIKTISASSFRVLFVLLSQQQLKAKICINFFWVKGEMSEAASAAHPQCPL